MAAELKVAMAVLTVRAKMQPRLVAVAVEEMTQEAMARSPVVAAVVQICFLAVLAVLAAAAAAVEV